MRRVLLFACLALMVSAAGCGEPQFLDDQRDTLLAVGAIVV